MVVMVLLAANPASEPLAVTLVLEHLETNTRVLATVPLVTS